MSEEYTVDYFIKKFEAIPEENWISGRYLSTDGYCALGHCGERRWGFTPESLALVDLFFDYELAVASVNDGNSYMFPQPTPKQRVLAACRYIKALQDV